MKNDSLLQLLKDMTIEEKIGQLNQVVGGFFDKDAIITGPMAEKGIWKEYMNLTGSMLGMVGAKKLKDLQESNMKSQPHNIPMLFMADIINGFSTIFPIPLAQGCTFNPELSKKVAKISAKESAVTGLHVTFSPMVDLVRDARWGRVMESTGEDSYLNSLFASAIVEGYQGDGLKDFGRIASCVKHFAAYGAPTGGRDYNNVELSERTLMEDYMPAYEAAIKSGCALVMTSFNSVNRIPATANEELLRDILRNKFGFEGVVISDWQSIEELIAHTIAVDGREAAKLAMKAGVDIDMMAGLYIEHLKMLITSNELNESLLDEAVLRILELKNKLGLFENPYKDADEITEKSVILCEEHLKVAKEVAVKSFVLLKNEEVLPLKKENQSLAFIGPYVDSKKIHGSWSMFANEEVHVTIKEAVGARSIGNQVSFAKGCEILNFGEKLEGFGDEVQNNTDEITARENLEEAIHLARNSEIVVLALGEHRCQSGEAVSRADITIPEIQMNLFREIHQVNSNIVVVLFNGRPLDLRELNGKAKAILEVWMPGTQGGNAIVDVLFGEAIPSGKLTMSFPRCVGQVPVFYNEFSTGRPYIPGKDRFRSKYIDIPNSPLYPFGYGLSYTQFNYSDIDLNKNILNQADPIIASVIVKNVGGYEAEETVQLYIRDRAGSVIRPVKELKGFKKVILAPGESEKVEFLIEEKMLRFYRKENGFGSEEGWFDLYIGTNSSEVKECEFYLVLSKG